MTTILPLLSMVVCLSIGASNGLQLQCYNSQARIDTCGQGQKCVQVVDKRNGSLGCGTCAEQQDPDDHDCYQCERDLCIGVKRRRCYDTNQTLISCDDPPVHKCVTLYRRGRVVEKTCGTCYFFGKHQHCEECASDGCNNQVIEKLTCLTIAGNQVECENARDECITIRAENGRVMEKRCGNCARNDYKCETCARNLCNDQPVKLLSCYTNANATQIGECSHPMEACITRIDASGRVAEKRCGLCMEGDTRCIQCNNDRCNHPGQKLVQPVNTRDVQPGTGDNENPSNGGTAKNVNFS